MKFSESWLREWVNPEISREELMSQLTMAGLEVDGVEDVAGSFSGVVVGEVTACDKHPDADKLSLCAVSDGTESHQVICGAPNVRVGLRVAFARVGAVLPENFKIKKAKLRGVESFGMLCSAQELGIGEDHDGILELPSHMAVGEDLRDAMDLEDAIIELDLTPNRGDCLSLKGVAREVGVLNNLAVSYPDIQPVEPTCDDTFPVSLASPEDCPRYIGRVIKGIDISKPTPGWMAERLRRCGLRSIDPVVDVTNYVLIELGQPMHAFDLQQIKEGIVVRKANAGEKLTLLDGQEVQLRPETLMITDATGPVAMAGVMGGERSGVQPDTSDVFLECAYFSPLAVAGTARSYGLQTDAAHRYERGVDYALQRDAVERATRLLLDIVGGEPGPLVDTCDEDALPKASVVSVRSSRLNELLGTTVAVAQVDEAFERLGFDVVTREDVDTDVRWTIQAPSHRFDIALEADLVEEVCRIYGYNNVPARRPVTGLELRTVELETSLDSQLKRQCAALGLQEVITYSFVDPVMQDLLDPELSPVELANPMSSEQSVMRTNLLAGLVAAARSNATRQQDRVRLFELGLVFRPGAAGLEQTQKLGGVLWGQRHAQSWHTASQMVDFFDVKGLVESLATWSGIAAQLQWQPAQQSTLHPGQSAQIMLDGRVTGFVGRLHPELEARLELDNVFVFELDAEMIMHRPRRVYAGVSRFPSVRRDLALVVDQSVSAAKIEEIVRQNAPDSLVNFRLFDVYEGKGIDSNEKSVAVGLTFQSQTATLTESEVAEFTDTIVSALASAVGARLR